MIRITLTIIVLSLCVSVFGLPGDDEARVLSSRIVYQ